MIAVVIDGMKAVLPKDFSFEFVRENNLFDKNEGFSFDMDFPLKNCPQNQKIFGALHTPAFDCNTGILPCTIYAGKVVLYGSVSVMGADNVSVKAQFIEGRDASEAEKVLDDTVINTLDLGEWPNPRPGMFIPGDRERNGAYFYPWTNEKYGVVNNCADYVMSGSSVAVTWISDSLSNQSSLLNIVQMILARIGYQFKDYVKFSKDIGTKSGAIVCNTLPASWEMRNFADALPAWSVKEFFEKLGKFYGGAFSFDHVSKKVSFDKFTDIIQNAGDIAVSDVLDDFSVTVSRDKDDAGYLPFKKVKFKDSDADIWKFWCCPEFLKDVVENHPDWIRTFNSVNDALPSIRQITPYPMYAKDRSGLAGSVIYIKDIDTYFLMRANYTLSESQGAKELPEKERKKYSLFAQLTPLNVFGPDITDYDPDADFEEYDFVPVVVDWTDNGQMMILDVGDNDDSDNVEDKNGEFWDGAWMWGSLIGSTVYISNSLSLDQNKLVKKLDEDIKDKKAYYDRIYIGFKVREDGGYGVGGAENLSFRQNSNQIAPSADVFSWLSFVHTGNAGKMRLKTFGYEEIKNRKIDPKVMYEFSFLSKDIPDVNARFLIKGKAYVCRKITASFSNSGMSELVKGEFYRIVE